jgi:hypothetical protein
MIGAVATFEREMMLERQREGIARAKSEGKYRGRKATARARAGEVAALISEGVGPTDIARQLGIGRASVYRILDSRPSYRGWCRRHVEASQSQKNQSILFDGTIHRERSVTVPFGARVSLGLARIGLVAKESCG